MNKHTRVFLYINYICRLFISTAGMDQLPELKARAVQCAIMGSLHASPTWAAWPPQTHTHAHTHATRLYNFNMVSAVFRCMNESLAYDGKRTYMLFSSFKISRYDTNILDVCKSCWMSPIIHTSLLCEVLLFLGCSAGATRFRSRCWQRSFSEESLQRGKRFDSSDDITLVLNVLSTLRATLNAVVAD